VRASANDGVRFVGTGTAGLRVGRGVPSVDGRVVEAPGCVDWPVAGAADGPAAVAGVPAAAVVADVPTVAVVPGARVAVMLAAGGLPPTALAAGACPHPANARTTTVMPVQRAHRRARGSRGSVVVDAPVRRSPAGPVATRAHAAAAS